MRPLINVRPTPEQLTILSRTKAGTEVIRGAAGSGKTTTALLKLRSTIGTFVARKQRQGRAEPVRILVLTYNRTLSGYIKELAKQQATSAPEIQLEVTTFSKWAVGLLGRQSLCEVSQAGNLISSLSNRGNLDVEFLIAETEYLMGRYLPADIPNYLTARREGRGSLPRMERPLREALLNEVVYPYQAWKKKEKLKDWNDLAVELCENKYQAYDVVIADETQDFSANQVRAVMNQLAPLNSTTFVLDTAQRIYARGFTWQEVGITVRPENSHRLGVNYRNTKEIARFAASIVNGITIDVDATLPDFNQCKRHGPVPLVLKGKFGPQVDFVIQHIKTNIDLSEESVAFFHPLGWFNYVKRRLNGAGLAWVDITRAAEWPQGSENIAFSTLHSAKGLEFDHVIILGLNAEVMTHGQDEQDDQLVTLRRLLAMGVGRAKQSVILGYKPDDASKLIDYFDPKTYNELVV